MYLYPNDIVAIWKTTLTLKEKIFILLLSNHNYLLKEVCTCWVLHKCSNFGIKWNILTLVFCSTVVFAQCWLFITETTENPACKGRMSSKGVANLEASNSFPVDRQSTWSDLKSGCVSLTNLK